MPNRYIKAKEKVFYIDDLSYAGIITDVKFSIDKDMWVIEYGEPNHWDKLSSVLNQYQMGLFSVLRKLELSFYDDYFL